MTHRADAVLFTADAALARRLGVYAANVVDLTTVATAADARRALEQRPHGILLADLRGPGSLRLLHEIVAELPRTVVIAIGIPRSDPMTEALNLGVYGALHPDVDELTVELLLRQTADRQRLTRELEILSTPPPPVAAAQRGPVREAALLRHLISPLRHFANVDSLLHGIIDGIASNAVVLRAGIFAATDEVGIYRFQAGVGCLDDTRPLLYRRDTPLVRWLELNAQAVVRSRLNLLRDVTPRLMLERALDTLGAELIVPLQGRASMLGWLFLGRRATGAPFDDTDIQDIMFLAEHVSTSLENALLFREVAFQKAFGETLLRSLPTGVIAATADGRLRWFNEAAGRILSLDRDAVGGQPVETLGPRLARALRACLAGQQDLDDEDWLDDRTNRQLSLHVARLGESGGGAVAFVYDRTREHLLNQRQQELERAAFWTELAASMSHEIRNPMVTIKTFAQLLPERYSDPEFRTEFSTLMSREVDRLDAIIQQINSFADRPKLHMDWLDLREAIEESRNLAGLRVTGAEPACDIQIDDSLPLLRGDRHALVECFTHVLTNALEALHGRKDGRIVVKAAAAPPANGLGASVLVTIRDNAGGIDPAIRDNVFSPFCTTKARAMGLGLPMVQRTVADHHGHVAIESGSGGTSVSIALPVTNGQEETAT